MSSALKVPGKQNKTIYRLFLPRLSCFQCRHVCIKHKQRFPACPARIAFEPWPTDQLCQQPDISCTRESRSDVTELKQAVTSQSPSPLPGLSTPQTAALGAGAGILATCTPIIGGAAVSAAPALESRRMGAPRQDNASMQS
jgi:hypothetical protein